MTEDELSASDEPRSDPSRFAAYHPPRHNDAMGPILDPLPPVETMERIRHGFEVDRLQQVADGIASDVDHLRALIGAPDPLAVRLSRLVERWRADGSLENLTTQDRAEGRSDDRPELESTSSTTVHDAELDARVRIALRDALVETAPELERITGAAADRLYEIERLVATSRAVFDSDEIAREWFGAALPVLRGGRPRDLLDTTIGREQVDELLHAIEYGFAA